MLSRANGSQYAANLLWNLREFGSPVPGPGQGCIQKYGLGGVKGWGLVLFPPLGSPSPSRPLPSRPFPLPFPFPPLPLEVGPLNPGRGPGGAL